MISVKNNVFKLDTVNTSYIFSLLPSGQLENLYYGKRIKDIDNTSPLAEKHAETQGTSVAYNNDIDRTLILDNICLEYSSMGKGDYRQPFVTICDSNGCCVNDFTYDSYTICDTTYCSDIYPTAYGAGATLEIKLVDKSKNIDLILFYTLFDDSDVIVKNARVVNNSAKQYSIDSLMSSQLDLPYCDYQLQTLDGDWIRERYITKRQLFPGAVVIDSKTGVSGNKHNPYIVLLKKDTTLNNGEAIGINLIYSGNHYESIEVSSHGKTRVVNGINPLGFNWTLAPNASFDTPQATLCFSSGGTNALSQQYHNFVNQHIISENYKNKVRPILVNNWEATYFKFDEKKLLNLAKSAKDVGIELFVLDDGWFGQRNDDTSSLGDWTVNTKKLTSGISGFADKINNLGLQFGLWFEPEMVNPNSNLYRNHPDWAITHPDYAASLGRNQLALDLTNIEVRDYIKSFLDNTLSCNKVDYVKWDFNRPLSDFYGSTLSNQGEFLHRYILGLYDILKYITNKYPNVLFESCASGGNRVDLGMLRYFPQYWTSDNTDFFDRNLIQEGTLTCYPQSTMGAHVSASPNHQTLRQSMIENRFNTACIGLLGYELDLTELSNADKKAVKEQIAFYKKYRQLLQFGTYYKLKSAFDDDNISWIVVSPDKKTAIAYFGNKIVGTNPHSDILRTIGLDDDTLYTISTRQQSLNVKAFGDLVNRVLPINIKQDGKLHDFIDNNISLKSEKETYTVYGDLLNNSGIKLSQQFNGSGYTDKTRVLQDFGSRIYVIEAVK